MKKAISFFVVSIVMYLVSLGAANMFGFGETYKAAGIIAIISGFIFLIFPLETLQFFGFFPKLPIGILIVVIWVLFGLILIAFCLLEIALPLAIGYYLINFLSLPPFSYMIGIIIYLTIWIALRKQYIKLISNTWDIGAEIIESSIEPFSEMISEINKFINKIYDWARTDK